MNTNHSPETPKNWVNRGMIALFFVLLWLPLADSTFKLDRVPLKDENRALATFPHYTSGITPVREYLSGIDAFYADHFGFRNQLVRWNNRWKRKYFNDTSVANVIAGKDHWLYYSGQDMAAHTRGMKEFTTEDLQNWKVALESRRDWLAKRGKKYLFVIPPDKETIYPEHLPDWLKRTGSLNKLDQFLTFMRANSTVEILDLRQLLRDAKKTTPTYYNSDTHWNYFGAFLGYQEIVKTLAKQVPDLDPPRSLSDFEMHHVTGIGMDLAKMLGQEKSIQEFNLIHLIPKPPLATIEVQEVPSIFPQKWEPHRVPLRTENPEKKYALLMFRDSFAGLFVPYLCYNFKRVDYIFQPEWDLDFIERENPDIVVDEMLERLFNNIDIKRLRVSP